MLNKKENAVVKKFTLIELLVVIGIIAVLAGLLTPAVLVAKTRARVLEAKTEANKIKIAIEQFKTDNNGLLPAPADSVEDTIIFNSDNVNPEDSSNKIELYTKNATKDEATSTTVSKKYDSKADYVEFFKKLAGFEVAPAPFDKVKNKRKKQYVTIKTIDPTKGLDEEENILGTFKDYWDSNFVILLDTNYDNKIYLKITDSKGSRNVTLQGSVFILSPGPNGKMNSGKNMFKINSALVKNYYLDKDTIKSFK